MYVRSEEYYNFFKLRSPFSPSIKALYVLSRGTVSFNLEFNLLKIRMQGIFENFNEDKNKNAWRNSSIHAALGAIKGGRLTGCKRFKAIGVNMGNGM